MPCKFRVQIRISNLKLKILNSKFRILYFNAKFQILTLNLKYSLLRHCCKFKFRNSDVMTDEVLVFITRWCALLPPYCDVSNFVPNSNVFAHIGPDKTLFIYGNVTSVSKFLQCFKFRKNATIL